MTLMVQRDEARSAGPLGSTHLTPSSLNVVRNNSSWLFGASEATS